MNDGIQYDFDFDALAIDVGKLVERSVASLYSHLVTRPTGRAVRIAIEAQLAEVKGATLSTIDLSEVTVLDFSCADEVVAKLLIRFQDASEEDGPCHAFFVFRGLKEPHRDPIQAVLERHSLVAVAEVDGRYLLLGTPSEVEREVWLRVEERGVVAEEEVDHTFDHPEMTAALHRLAARRVLYRGRSGFSALSRLVEVDAPQDERGRPHFES